MDVHILSDVVSQVGGVSQSLSWSGENVESLLSSHSSSSQQSVADLQPSNQHMSRQQQ